MPTPLPIFLTNTYGRKLEEFQPLSPPQVKLYTCGPTVYSFAHIGNFRSFIFADTLRRVLEYNGYNVQQVRNITDVGHLTNDTLGPGLDKIEAAAREQNRTPWDIARYYTDIFRRDARRLNLEEPSSEPRATAYIGPMIALVERLIERGYAYVSDGNVYFEVAKFPPYGALSRNSVEELIAGARVEVGEGKRSPADFALWKRAEPDKIMRWESPWGPGVPGWHLECSAMALDLLGPEIDIHTGGEDHIFPHHEDEIAQSEVATGRPFARYWLHGAFLQVGEKMSKSLGNTITVSDLVERGIHPLAYRYFTYQAHYRTTQNFSWSALDGAQTALVRLWQQAAELWQAGPPAAELGPEAEALRARFHEAINRDLDLPVALAVIHETMGARLVSDQKLALLQDADRVLGLDFLPMARRLSEVSPESRSLLEERAAVRREKNWARSDEIRAELAAAGVEVKDTGQGQRWFRRDVPVDGNR